MASAFSHGVAAAGIAACFYKPEVPKRVWGIAVACLILPDIDVIGFQFGIHYGDFWGHRGFTHSLVFAALLAAAIVGLVLREGVPGMSAAKIWLLLFLATASHGFLDALTNGGLGVAFLSPFDTQRFFLPWRPILVSPISAGQFFSQLGLTILQSEFLWIWIPTVVLVLGTSLARASRRRRRKSQENSFSNP